MRRALKRRVQAALLALALLAPAAARAAEPRPLLRLVLAASDTPPWFDGFSQHLRRELELRGIDVIVVRDASARPLGESGRADAELVVDAPTAQRPVLRFAVSPAAPRNGHVRQVNLTRVPSDGCALALAAAADELMRSTWPRAVPVARSNAASARGAPSAGGGGRERAVDGEPSAEKERGEKERAEKGGGEKSRGTEADRGAEKDGAASRAEEPSSDSETNRDTSASEAATTRERDATDADPGAVAPRGPRPPRFALGVAAAAEAFTGGQSQIGADVRWSVPVLGRLDLELRGGWRAIVRRDAPHGAVEGTTLLGGAALSLRLWEGPRGAFMVVGRADFLRAAYTASSPDPNVQAIDGGAFGVIASAGPRGQLALTRSLSLDAEILAGASPLATTATDAGNAVLSTNGAAFLASLGLSFRL